MGKFATAVIEACWGRELLAPAEVYDLAVRRVAKVVPSSGPSTFAQHGTAMVCELLKGFAYVWVGGHAFA
jgi:hypothetical protein